MATEVSVNLFDIEWSAGKTQKLSETLDEFSRLPLDQRWRGEIRLEQIQEEDVARKRVYLLDFTKRREVGPGRLGHRAPIADIKLDRDEDFGEETAALYCPAKKWLLVLHNQSGVGPSRMMSYFNALDPGVADRHFDYGATPQLDPTAVRRFRGMKKISTVRVTATVGALAAAQADAGDALASATRAVNAKRITFELKANSAWGRGDVLSQRPTMQFIEGLQGQNDEVTKLEVVGQIDGRDQMINLLEHRVRRKYSVAELQVLHHRYTLESRWKLLLRTFTFWQENL